MFKVVYKKDRTVYDVYNISIDKSGKPQFLILGKADWHVLPAKFFSTPTTIELVPGDIVKLKNHHEVHCNHDVIEVNGNMVKIEYEDDYGPYLIDVSRDQLEFVGQRTK